MFSETGHEYIRKAIESAQLERDKLLEELKEFEKIKERLGQIEAFINQGKLLLGDKSRRNDVKELDSKPTRIPYLYGEKTNPEKIVEILRASGRAMTVPEIANEFKARNWHLSEKSRMQIIRNALKGKPGWFEKEGTGLWNLKERIK
jgi:hypothetical protein